MHLPVGEENTILASRKGSRLSAGIVASVAATSGLLFGFDTAVINGALVFLRAQFALTDLLTEIAASSLVIGCLAGASIAGVASDRIGRRKSLIAAALLFAASALTSAAAQKFSQFCVSRLAGGLAIGIASTLTPVYISEIVPHNRRGQLVSLNQLAVVIGILLAFFTNWQLSALGSVSWRWMFAVAAVPSVGFLAGLLFIPESPRWLIARGFRSQGHGVLRSILGETEAATELAAIGPVLMFASVLLYVAFFAVGLGPGVWVYIAEIFPTRVRGRATSLATSALWTACLAVTLTFLSIVHALGASAAFLLYAAVSLLTFYFIWIWVPETRGKSLEDIQRMWEQLK